MRDADNDNLDPFTDEALRRYQEEPEEAQEDQILQRLADRGRRIDTRITLLIQALKELKIEEKEVVFDVILGPLKEEIRNETVIATLTVIRSSTNPHLSIDCLKLITGMAAQEGKRGSDYADVHKRYDRELDKWVPITRQAVNKEVNLLRKKLGIKRQSIDTRSEEVCEMSRRRELAANILVKRKLTLALQAPNGVTDQQVTAIIEQYND